MTARADRRTFGETVAPQHIHRGVSQRRERQFDYDEWELAGVRPRQVLPATQALATTSVAPEGAEPS